MLRYRSTSNMRYFICALLLATIGVVSVAEAQVNKKRAQTSMKFLSTSLSAKASALGDAMTSLEGEAYSVFYNPAGAARTTSTFSVVGGHVSWIADINYSFASVLYRPGSGQYGVFSLHATTVDYGEIQETILGNNEKGYYDLGNFRPNAVVFGVGYARAITNLFSVGANVKYINQNLGPATTGIRDDGSFDRNYYSANTVAIDFGVLYKTGFESLAFGMSVRNFSQEVSFDEENTELPLTFRIGISADVFDFLESIDDKHSLLVAIDANRPRDFDEQVLFGIEYGFINRFFLRGGYGFPNDEQGFSTGIGVNQPVGAYGLAVDYSYTDFGVFSGVNRISFRLSF